MIENVEYHLDKYEKIYLIGAGKACAAMAIGIDMKEFIEQNQITFPIQFRCK